MDHDSTDNPDDARARKPVRGSAPDVPPQETERRRRTSIPPPRRRDEDDERGCRTALEESGKRSAKGRWRPATRRSSTRSASRRPRPASIACSMPQATCSMSARRRTSESACRPMRAQSAPQPARIAAHDRRDRDGRVRLDPTETEALLLEANLIKRLRPRFNVQLRDDKSFPYILITGDHWAPQILKHRGAQHAARATISARSPPRGAVDRTITALQRAFLIRSCTDSFFESRTRPCLLYQIKRCSGAVHRRDRFPRLCRAGARGDATSCPAEPAR